MRWGGLWPELNRQSLLGSALLAAQTLLAASSMASACTLGPPHYNSDMPGSISNRWPSEERGTIAWYHGATTRYPHGVLGDTIEATRLSIYAGTSWNSCGDQTIGLPEELVFEDVAPRLADLDADGIPEIIVVQSHQRLGAQLAVYRARENGFGLDLVATTPFIGRSNRWLAPIGMADFDGDGARDIAYIDRPHLARTLRVWRFEDDTLTEIAALEGLTNHRIGEPFITGGVRDCGAGPEMVTADTAWAQDMITRIADGQAVSRAVAPFSQAAVADALACRL